ncbi:MAG: response regulator transcription factor [Sandaracinaceae bacterium]
MSSPDVNDANDSNKPQRLLVVEDEEHLAAGLKLNLELEGYRVAVAANAREAGEHMLKPDGFDAIVLDVQLPDIDGFELCKKIRGSGNYTPVIMLTARSAAEDRVKGLESGADDYLVKPFELDELLARVRSMLRRQQWERRQEPGMGARARFGRASIDFETHEVLVEGEKVELTRLELDLVRYFIQNPGRVLSREELLAEVWKLRNYSTARTVDNFISRLRRHFEIDPQQPTHFLSVRGSGYKFVP